jgi:hypothetical protein
LVSEVLAAIGLLRDGFLLGGEADEEADDRVGEDDFFTGTGIGRTIATGLTAVGDTEPCEVWSSDTRRSIDGLYTDSRLDSDPGELIECDISTKLPQEALLGSKSE